MSEGGGLLTAALLGIVEGLTEFLPISSTGHLIVANRWLGGNDPAFEIAIQVGAITAIAVLYRRRLAAAAGALLARRATGARVNLWVLIVAAALPAAVLGLAFDDWLEAHLFTPTVVAVAMIAGGVVLLALERWIDRRRERGAVARTLDDMTVAQALGVGLCQCLALIPGTSRSGATIAGALVLGYDRVAAAELSFFVGLPVLYGACLLKIVEERERFLGPQLPELALGCAVSFVTAYVVVAPFVRYLQNHTFRPFAWYRLVAGAALLALIRAGLISAD